MATITYNIIKKKKKKKIYVAKVMYQDITSYSCLVFYRTIEVGIL